MNINRWAFSLSALLFLTFGMELSARRIIILPRRSYYHYEPVSLEVLAGTCCVAIGLAAIVGYLSSESEAQKAARLERERQRLEMIEKMTPEQREIYYNEERLKIEREKAQAQKDQANAAWWNAFATPFVSYPYYGDDIIIID